MIAYTMIDSLAILACLVPASCYNYYLNIRATSLTASQLIQAVMFIKEDINNILVYTGKLLSLVHFHHPVGSYLKH